MTYRHYETEGVIIGYHNLSEASRLYQILTSDLGLINALAQGVRRGQSKLRYGLKNLSFCRLTLVRGRDFWRVVGVDNLILTESSSQEGIFFLKRIALLLQRLIHGEGTDPLIFQDLKRAFVLISSPALEGKEEANTLEVFIVSRLLLKLGYLFPPVELRDVFLQADFSWSEVEKIKSFRLLLIQKINKALKASHL